MEAEAAQEGAVEMHENNRLTDERLVVPPNCVAGWGRFTLFKGPGRSRNMQRDQVGDESVEKSLVGAGTGRCRKSGSSPECLNS